MVFDDVTDNQRQHFFRQRFNAHLPGYTGHCPTLKFRVGKRYGACTEEVMKEMLEKKILKTGPYKSNSSKDTLLPISCEKDIKRDRTNVSCIYKSSPYILGYTGYIPGYNNRYGLTFMKAVEEGAVEWCEIQSKLKTRRDAMQAQAEMMNPRHLLPRVQTGKRDVENDYRHNSRRQYFNNQMSAEFPPIVGYTGHIPGAKDEIALSKRYAQAVKKSLEHLQKERQSRFGSVTNANKIHRVLEEINFDDIDRTMA